MAYLFGISNGLCLLERDDVIKKFLIFFINFFCSISLGKDFFVYVSPDPIGVNAFLQMGKTGTEAAAKKFGADVQTYESSTAAARRENVEAALNEGATLIVLLGFGYVLKNRYYIKQA